MERIELTKMAQILRSGGADLNTVHRYVRNANGQLTEDEVVDIVREACLENPPQDQTLTSKVKEYIKNTTTWFTYTDMYRDLMLSTAQDRSIARMAVKQMKDAGKLEPNRKIEGKYRVKGQALEKVDWQSADTGKVFDMWLPFDLHKYCDIYPKSIIMFAGEKDSAKSTFAHNIIKNNIRNVKIPQPIRLLNSEAGPEEIKARLMNHTDVMIQEWTHEMYSCNRNYADYIIPDGLNIVDYMEVRDGEYAMISDQIRDIHDALEGGVAVIFIQKDAFKELGMGADKSREKARIYCTLNRGDVFNWLIVKTMKLHKLTQSPVGLKIFYKVSDGGSTLTETHRVWPHGEPVMRVVLPPKNLILPEGVTFIETKRTRV